MLQNWLPTKDNLVARATLFLMKTVMCDRVWSQWNCSSFISSMPLFCFFVEFCSGLAWHLIGWFLSFTGPRYSICLFSRRFTSSVFHVAACLVMLRFEYCGMKEITEFSRTRKAPFTNSYIKSSYIPFGGWRQLILTFV